MKKLLMVATFAFVSHAGFAQQDEALKKDVLKVIEMSGAANQMKTAKDQILQMVPKEKQAAFIVEFDATLPSFYDKIAAIYMEEYTKEDIKAMLAYYESPVGKKISANAGVIMEKSQKAGLEWGEGLQGMMMKYVQQ
jgi:hypothetical protein